MSATPIDTAPGVCRWILQPAGRRPGILSINGKTYLFEVLRHSDQPYGFRLSREGDGQAEYQLPTDLSACDCYDALHKARPGGCKHRRALAAALKVFGTVSACADTLF
jgi:hypothetical protein